MRILSNTETKILNKMIEQVGTSLPTCIYARKSKEDLSSEALNVQVDICKRFIQDNNKYLTHTTTFQEDNVSGMTIDGRPEFKKLIQAVEDGMIKIVVISKWDRLSRNTTDLKMLRQSFNEKGVLIITLEDSGESSAIDQLQFEIISAINQYYVHKISEDTKSVLITKASKGHSGGGVANYGYRFDSENFLIMEPSEAIVVSDIYNKFELGYSYQSIIDYLKLSNIKTRKGNDFTRSMIHDILTNVKYRGVYRYNRSDRKQRQLTSKYFDEVWVEGGVKTPIITVEQFNRVQAIMKQNKHQKSKSPYLLSGLMVCAHCATPMIGSSQSGGKGKPRKNYYICKNHLKRNGGTCINVGIDADSIETQVKQLVLDVVNVYVATPEFSTAEFSKLLDSKKKLKASINKSIDNLVQSQSTLIMRLGDAALVDAVKSAVEGQISKLTTDITELKAKLEIANQQIKQYEAIGSKTSLETFNLSNLYSNNETTKQLIQIVVNSITIGQESIKIELLENKGIQ